MDYQGDIYDKDDDNEEEYIYSDNNDDTEDDDEEYSAIGSEEEDEESNTEDEDETSEFCEEDFTTINNNDGNYMKDISENQIIKDIWEKIPKSTKTRFALMEFIINYYVTNNYGLNNDELISIGNNIGIRLGIINFHKVARHMAKKLM